MGISGFCRAPRRASAPTSTSDSFQVGSSQLTPVPRPTPVVGVEAGGGPEAGVAVSGEGELAPGVLVGQDGVGGGLGPALDQPPQGGRPDPAAAPRSARPAAR